MPSKTIEDFAYQVRDYMRSAEVVEGKNLCRRDGVSQNIKDVVWTVNADGSVTANGKSTTGDSVFWYSSNEVDKRFDFDETVVVSGVSGGSSSTYFMGGTGVTSLTDGSAEFPAHTSLSVALVIKNNYQADNVTFYPMICTLTDWEKSHTYKPYYVPVKDRVEELTDAVTPEDGTITAYTGVGITLNTTWTNCKKIGNLVIANARFTVGNSDITSGKILTLPYTCINQGSIEGFTRQANGVPVLFNTVANDKNIHLTGRNNLLANTEYILSFVYVTND